MASIYHITEIYFIILFYLLFLFVLDFTFIKNKSYIPKRNYFYFYHSTSCFYYTFPYRYIPSWNRKIESSSQFYNYEFNLSTKYKTICNAKYFIIYYIYNRIYVLPKHKVKKYNIYLSIFIKSFLKILSTCSSRQQLCTWYQKYKRPTLWKFLRSTHYSSFWFVGFFH